MPLSKKNFSPKKRLPIFELLFATLGLYFTVQIFGPYLASPTPAPAARHEEQQEEEVEAMMDPSALAGQLISPLCGNGHMDPGEACDDANRKNGDGCAQDCTRMEFGFLCSGTVVNGKNQTVCQSAFGNGSVNLSMGEECDDGNIKNGDGCSMYGKEERGFDCSQNGPDAPSTCVSRCGNGIVERELNEACDDGNTADGDGCTRTCGIQELYSCSEQSGQHSTCAIFIGNGQLQWQEQCDDGNRNAGDGCSAAGKTELGWHCDVPGAPCVRYCGDGVAHMLGGLNEACDLGSGNGPASGCSASCGVNPGWTCVVQDGATSCSNIVCGNGKREAGEVCDDGNTANGDGCRADCKLVEADALCTTDSSGKDVCVKQCGNGVVQADRGEQCDPGADPASQPCCDPLSCRLKGKNTLCRAETGMCDAAEVCSGSSPVCPADTVKPATTVCRGAEGMCDVAEMCDGSTKECPAADAVKPSGTICRPTAQGGAGACDVAEACDGTAKACPADLFLPSTQTCRQSAGICDTPELCTGISAACPVDYMKPKTEVCRGAAGVCDRAETCTGNSPHCPNDAKEPSKKVCRGAAGSCDVAERCTGNSNDCPGDSYKPSGTECQAKAGACDVAERCSGASPSCPTDAVLPAGTVCRGAVGACDNAESCDGSAKSCPVDQNLPSSVTCRASTGACDQPEYCSGKSGGNGRFCPTDRNCTNSYKLCGNGRIDTEKIGTINVREQCDDGNLNAGDGCSNICQREAGFQCARASASSPDVCVALCGNGRIDAGEQCDGGPCCTSACTLQSAGTVCRPSAGACDLAESCNGAAPTCPADVIATADTRCRASNGACDAEELCTGFGKECPADAFAPTGTSCQNQQGQTASCTGAGVLCPFNAQ